MPATVLAGLALAGWAFLLAVVADMGRPLARLMMPATPGWTPAVAAGKRASIRTSYQPVETHRGQN